MGHLLEVMRKENEELQKQVRETEKNHSELVRQSQEQMRELVGSQKRENERHVEKKLEEVVQFYSKVKVNLENNLNAISYEIQRAKE